MAMMAVLVAAVGCSLPAPLQDAVEMPEEQPLEEGLRWETDVADHPPAPQNVHAIAEGTGVRVTWEEPLKVAVPHSYSDVVKHYRVFRRLAANTDATEIGTTDQLFYVDSDPPSGLVFYHVTAVHEGDAESDRSDETDVVLGAE
jgi:hypothetical protein